MRTIIRLVMVACGLSVGSWALAQDGVPAGPERGAAAIGTAFTYQGRLTLSGQPATGSFPAEFRLFDLAMGGIQIGATVMQTIDAQGGIFSTTLDFGSGPFATNSARWLETRVNGENLSPRQALTGTPHSLSTRGLIVNSAGQVGIGTESPSTSLSFGTSAPTGRPTVAVREDLGANYYGIGITAAEATLDFWAGNLRHMVLSNTGNVGIGTLPNAARLHVHGNTKISNNFFLEFGAGLDKEPNAGKIGYQLFTQGLDIVGAGDSAPERRVTIWAEKGCTIQGPCSMTKAIILGGADVAENYDVAPAAGDGGAIAPTPGMVVVIDPNATGKLMVSSNAYDRRVAGIISGADGVNPGLILGQKGTAADGELPVANVGRVWCLCDAGAGGPIEPGDLLVSSDTPGHAMRAGDVARSQGAVLGKAMSRLDSGRGTVLVLVSLQ